MIKIKQKLIDYLITIHSYYMDDMIDIKKNKQPDYFELLNKSAGLFQFTDSLTKHVNNYDYEKESQKRKYVQNTYLTEITVFRNLLDIHEEFSFDEINKEATKSIKNNNDFKYIIKNGRVLPKLELLETTKI